MFIVSFVDARFTLVYYYTYWINQYVFYFYMSMSTQSEA